MLKEAGVNNAENEKLRDLIQGFIDQGVLEADEDGGVKAAAVQEQMQ